MTNIDSMIAEAGQRGAQLPATVDRQPVQQHAPHRAPSLDDITNGGMSVDNWLKVTEDGLKIVVEQESAMLETLKVSIEMPSVTATTAIKFGNPPTYFKTYDGLVCADGSTRWTDAIEQAARFNARPYSSADIPMTLEENVVSKKGKTIMEAGQRIGYSLSTTNREAFAKFLKQLEADDDKQHTVDVLLGYEAKTNRNKQTWGIVTFLSEGEHAE